MGQVFGHPIYQSCFYSHFKIVFSLNIFYFLNLALYFHSVKHSVYAGALSLMYCVLNWPTSKTILKTINLYFQISLLAECLCYETNLSLLINCKNCMVTSLLRTTSPSMLTKPSFWFGCTKCMHQINVISPCVFSAQMYFYTVCRIMDWKI